MKNIHLTRPILSALLVCSLFFNSAAQPSEKIITEKYVQKVIATLASDDMRGRSALSPDDINRAATFIEKEFKKAKLKPLTGLNGFRQSFTKKKVALEKLEVIVDGLPVAEDRLLLSSPELTISMNSETLMDTIGKNQPLFPSISQFEKKGGYKIVSVAPEHVENFKIAQNYLSRPKLLDTEATSSGATLYILGQTKPKTIQVTASQTEELVVMNNIVGMIEGKSKKDEFVIFSAHYDHIGIQDPMEGDSIANGADDDASGTTAVMTLARYFSKVKSNERTLIFVAFTAEEIGGYGSQYFSRQLNADKVMAMFNIEMIGKASKWGSNSAFITGFERSNFGSILQKNTEGTFFSFHPDPYPEQNLFYRSDNATLARLGVPAHSISTDQIPTDPYYHTVDDEIETLDMANIVAAIKAIAQGSKSIVSGQESPSRIDKASVH